MKWILLLMIRIYQLTLSPVLGPICRFTPSCSHYGYEAIKRHGAFTGTILTVKRIGRCHPFHPGGHDPVPDRGQIDFLGRVRALPPAERREA